MTIVCNELTLEQINSALLRLQRSIQSNTNNFQNDVQKAVANVTVNSKNVVQKYDDSYLMSLVADLRDKYKNLNTITQDNILNIIKLETILANVSLDYDENTNAITFNLGDYSTTFALKDTTYDFSYDTETGDFTIVDNVTGETVFEETFNDTTYTFSFANGILTIHNNLLNTDQTFNFDSRYYTEAEIQSLILDKIPSEASSTNQLADKDFVNSSISTATATFRGTVTTTQALAALTGDLNDYAFLQNIDPTTGQTLSYDRYKWVESGGDYGHWKYEYTLNNSSFTSDQWAAINSGITCQIVTDLLDGCYSGTGSALCKSGGNEWRNILATNCDCSGSVDADYIYYNTNVRVNQCTGALNAVCYYVCDKGWVPYSKCNLTASSLGLTAGCCYPITCILDLLRCCFGSQPATYVFQYANAANPMVCETGGHAYCLSFTKLDAINVTTACWQRDHWLIEDHVTGKRWTASSYSAATIGSWTWNLNSNRTTCAIYKFRKDADYPYPLIFANNANEDFGCVNVSCGCAITFNPATGVLSTKCFVGDNQYHAIIPSPQGNTSTYYATIVLDDTCVNAETYMVFNSYNAEYHLLTWFNGSSCLTEIKDIWYADSKYSIDSVGVSTCKDNTSCIYIKYCGYRPTTVNSSKKIKCIIYGCKTAPSNVSWTTALKGIACSRDATCFGGCTYADACADIRSGLISGGSFNGTDGTVNNGCLSFSDINFDNICNSTSKGVAANNITRRYLITNQISSVGYITRWGLGLERGTTGWGTGLLSLGVKDDGTCFADYKFTHAGNISLTCCGTAKCITLEGCATKNVFTCCLASASNTQRYFQIKTKANRGSNSVSFDFDFFSMNGTINLDNNICNQYYAGTYYGCLCVSVCGYTCACCDCFWLTYKGYRTLTLKSVYDFEVLCNTTTAPTGVTFCCFVKRPGSVTKVDVSDDAPYNVLLSKADNDTAMLSIGSNDNLTYNPNTGVFNVTCGTVSACNTERWSTVYSSNTYNTGYYLIAEYKTNENGSGNHDITIGGCVDVADTWARKPLRFKASIRGNKCTVNFAQAWVDSSLAADYLAFTRSVDNATCTFDLRIYAKISSYYTRFNTTIDYLAAGDVNLRKSNYLGCLTFPNTYAANTTAFVGTIIPSTCSCGVVAASYYKTEALSICCTFPANSTSYILLGCYTPSNTACNANELDLGVALGGGNLVEKGSLKLLLTTGCCNASSFSNNNIEAKFSNYADSCYGVRNLIFTSGGNSWSCSIGIWLQVCNPSSAACTWAIDLLRNKIDSRFTSCLTCATATSGTRVCTIAIPAMRNFYFNNAEQNCFACVLSTNILCTGSFRPLPSIICGNCTQCYIHLGCYQPTILCANELDLTLTVGDAGNNSVNIKALLTTGCLNEFYKNNIRVNAASVDRSHAYIDSVLFTTIGTAWNCSINVYAVVCSTAACTCYTLYNNKQDTSFKKCFEVLSSLPPAPLKCAIPVNGDSVTVLSAPLLISTWKRETSASASFALGCNSYTTLVIGGVNDVRSPTYQKLLISTCITGSENPLNMWIDYMGGYGDRDFITACFSGANCNVIVPMRISSDSQNIYIDLATCTCAARDLCATIYSSCPMPLGSCGNSVRTTSYTANFITDASCAYCYVMCQWPTTITLNVDDPASQFATRILSANTISAYCMATISDVRQKKDIVPYNNGLCDISKLDIISFRYKNEDSSCVKHVSIPANWTNPLLSGEKQNQLRVNDAVGILLGAVKDLAKSMTLSQKIKLWLYKKFIEPKNNKNINKKLKNFN